MGSSKIKLIKFKVKRVRLFIFRDGIKLTLLTLAWGGCVGGHVTQSSKSGWHFQTVPGDVQLLHTVQSTCVSFDG